MGKKPNHETAPGLASLSLHRLQMAMEFIPARSDEKSSPRQLGDRVANWNEPRRDRKQDYQGKPGDRENCRSVEEAAKPRRSHTNRPEEQDEDSQRAGAQDEARLAVVASVFRTFACKTLRAGTHKRDPQVGAVKVDSPIAVRAWQRADDHLSVVQPTVSTSHRRSLARTLRSHLSGPVLESDQDKDPARFVSLPALVSSLKLVAIGTSLPRATTNAPPTPAPERWRRE